MVRPPGEPPVPAVDPASPAGEGRPASCAALSRRGPDALSAIPIPCRVPAPVRLAESKAESKPVPRAPSAGLPVFLPGHVHAIPACAPGGPSDSSSGGPVPHEVSGVAPEYAGPRGAIHPGRPAAGPRAPRHRPPRPRPWLRERPILAPIVIAWICPPMAPGTVPDNLDDNATVRIKASPVLPLRGRPTSAPGNRSGSASAAPSPRRPVPARTFLRRPRCGPARIRR